ncbi:hypothetical protein ES319_A03G042800v1 [Gossypium barbadense]|uniref:RRM domain-containing protein n=1 Tax=Gossypium barbadense TaxID=3634 RepID=A0A5J5WAK0_GOSBA|nr:hypothetical protein ES319_A03G042800v1 [Gossypium barbadense]KAB2089160.1 hypothetical protein ES319_A03G042800v1 [Gossypium barbadense]
MARKRKQSSSDPEPPKIASEPQPAQEKQQQQPVYIPEDPNPNPNVDEEQQVLEVEEEIEEEVEVEEEFEEEEEEEEEDDEDDEEAENETLVGSSYAAVLNGARRETGREDECDDEPVEKLLEPFAKDQLITLIKKAVENHPDFISSVREFADADPAHRKIFVHGLSWDTTAETLTGEFSKYGEIEECKAVTDKVSGKSKGYAFILFKHRSGARRALKQPQKKIGIRTTSCQLAVQGPVPAPPPTGPPVSEYAQRKIFVSNVSPELDPGHLLEFFKQYGEIEEGPMGLDKQTGKPKGFALFVYRSVDSAKKALEEPHKNFQGHVLHCQKAIDGPKQTKGVSGGHHQQYQHHHQGQHQSPSHHHHAKKGKYSTGGSETGHLMAPSGPAGAGFNHGVAPAGFNPGVAAVAAPGLNPALGQALTALLTSHGAGLGLGNLLGGFTGAAANQGAHAAGYGNQVAGGYGNQMGVQGGYHNPQLGQGGAGRSQPGGGAPYMGH